MTIEHVRKWLDIIQNEANKGDDEVAHSSEDSLHSEVLRAIANGTPNAAELALEALKSHDIQFSRWYA